MNENLFIAFFVGLTLACIITFCYMLFFMLRNMRLSGSDATPMQHDLTNMMILFQTMRDTVEQQKSLARRFNRTIDAKVQEIRALTESTAGLDDRVQTMEAELDQVLVQAREELNSMRRRWEYLQEQIPTGSESTTGLAAGDTKSECAEPDTEIEASGKAHDSPPAPQPEAQPEKKSESSNGHPTGQPLRVLPTRTEAPSAEPLDSWTGLDFGSSDYDDEDDYDDPPAEMELTEPEEPEAARDAFRMLLNMDSPTMDPNPPIRVDDEIPDTSSVTPVQQRIYEYSDAGMRVPEIARELGVGKGEVRLILSLRKDKTA